MKEKSDGNRDCGWLCQHRTGEGATMTPVPVPVWTTPCISCNIKTETCKPRKQEPQYLTCQYDSRSIFEDRTWNTDWDNKNCWCNSGDCFRQPCKCSSCKENV